MFFKKRTQQESSRQRLDKALDEHDKIWSEAPATKKPNGKIDEDDCLIFVGSIKAKPKGGTA